MVVFENYQWIRKQILDFQVDDEFDLKNRFERAEIVIKNKYAVEKGILRWREYE